MHIYDLDTTRWLAWVPVGRGRAGRLAVDVATGRVYVSNGGDDTVSIFQDSGPVQPRHSCRPARRPSHHAFANTNPDEHADANPHAHVHGDADGDAAVTPTATATPTATLTPWLPGNPDEYEPDDTPSQPGS